MVTQKDVAKLAGVSFITVSRVINGETNVKEETRKKVLAAIDQLGYAPGFAGQALNSGKCNSIAILTPIPFFENMRTFYLMSVLSGIEEVCRRKNVDLMLGVVPEASEGAAYDYLRPYRQKKVDGIIYVGLRQIPADMLHELELRHLPCVVVGDRPTNDLVSWVDTDNYQAGYNTVKQMWEKGHRRIAFLGLQKTIYNANISDREQGFCQALKDYGVPYKCEDYIIRTEYETDRVMPDVYNAFCHFEEKPTALFCCADSTVPASVKALEKCGLSVPNDVSIVGFDGFINSTNFYLNVATNPQPLKCMGEKAAEILFAHIKNPDSPKDECILSVPFEDGDSLKQV